jgi:hypothetical protein
MKPEKQSILFLLVPVTFGMIMFIISDLLWAFGNPCLIADYYRSRFNGPMEANLWIINEMGTFGCIMCLLCLFCYFKLTFYLFKK